MAYYSPRIFQPTAVVVIFGVNNADNIKTFQKMVIRVLKVCFIYVLLSFWFNASAKAPSSAKTDVLTNHEVEPCALKSDDEGYACPEALIKNLKAL